ncbi:hypothetical protein C0995_010699 [Termitomyces sp. Mi166|nr:hypothetical protein C0995_010699 [Termitomyces sp. Mi166\
MVVSWKHAISTIEQIKLMHFEKMVIELELTAPIVAPKTVVNPAPTPVSATLLIHAMLLTQEPSRCSVPRNKGMAPKTPVAGPSTMPIVPSSALIVPSSALIVPSSALIVPSFALIVPSSVPKPAAAAALSKPAPAKSASPAVKGGSIVKDPFMVRRFKLAGTEESRALIINQVTEVLVTQETLREEKSSDKDDEDGQGDNDNSNNDYIAMDIDSAKHPEET